MSAVVIGRTVTEAVIEILGDRIGVELAIDALEHDLPERLCTCLDCDCRTYRTALGICRFCQAGKHDHRRRTEGPR